MNAYAFRVDTIDPAICGHIASHYSPDCYLFASEGVGSDNPHTHFYLEMTSQTREALKAYIRKYVGEGNQNYSSKRLDSLKPVEYLAYVIKCGDYSVLNVDLTKAKEYDFNVKASKSKNLKKNATVMQDIENVFEYQAKSRFLDRHVIIHDVIQYYKEKGVLIRESTLVSLCQTLMLKYLPDYVGVLSHNIDRAIDKSRF